MHPESFRRAICEIGPCVVELPACFDISEVIPFPMRDVQCKSGALKFDRGVRPTIGASTSSAPALSRSNQDRLRSLRPRIAAAASGSGLEHSFAWSVPIMLVASPARAKHGGGLT